ncbi:3-deoxy-7-phosphoheptulonate synthase [Alkalimarinus sediminis]|uniref:Phospho-2-dehydro-3-deoxyheptonate aldolase n=1 Tax=Alkalimarinus sediminis TaxID=1632866 RepID=A0A9E8KIX2_9ALTE|nr:3-deoxy-7-phosphoheptulonate synthase [Alkalimarinus sediminis]UZW74376.1 3-deoxy-7-phosphoheptulonate synthase [Alkalimarinus sediminis]
MTHSTSIGIDQSGVAERASTVVDTLPSSGAIKSQLKAKPELLLQVQQQQQAINRIVTGADSRLMVVTGPCSIHDMASAMDYGRRLARLADQVSDRLCLVMRCYFEKPRTTVGWKGMLHDPSLDGSHDMNKGLRLSRTLLLELAGMGLPLATEALSPLAISYFDDLISWVAVGARTTESQPHREMASGLNASVGFKNATDGSFTTAIHSIKSAANSHAFMGLSENGEVGVVRTGGNPNAHIVLRGGNGQPNYDALNIARCQHALRDAGLNERIMIDCSHENSGKDHLKQPLVLSDIAAQIQSGNRSIMGVMIESHINEHRQDISADMEYGVSVTDACMSWEQTERSINGLYAMLGK